LAGGIFTLSSFGCEQAGLLLDFTFISLKPQYFLNPSGQNIDYAVQSKFVAFEYFIFVCGSQ
jgi:hypothetical protein